MKQKQARDPVLAAGLRLESATLAALKTMGPDGAEAQGEAFAQFMEAVAAVQALPPSDFYRCEEFVAKRGRIKPGAVGALVAAVHERLRLADQVEADQVDERRREIVSALLAIVLDERGLTTPEARAGADAEPLQQEIEALFQEREKIADRGEGRTEKEKLLDEWIDLGRAIDLRRARAGAGVH